MEYTKEEIKHIEILNWDKGWRRGLLAASVFWVIIMVVIKLLLLLKY